MSVKADRSNSFGTVIEPSRETRVRDEVDVLVAGGGLGGVSAAVAAARAGARTLLVERNGYPGGVATAGMCCSVFNCFYTPSHELVVKGNALEFVDELANAEGPGSGWRSHRGHIIYDVERAKLALIQLLENAGVSCLFDALIVDAILDGKEVRGAVIQSKSGREAIRSTAVVDATGDADLADLAGAPVRRIGGAVKARHSYCFRVGNVDVDRFVQYFVEHPDQYAPYMDVDWEFEDAYRQYRETGTLLFPHGGGMQLSLMNEAVADGEFETTLGVHDTLDALQMHAIRDLGVVHIVTGHVVIDDLDVGKISRAMSDGKRLAFYVTDFFRKFVPGFERAAVIATADDLGMRATRWIEGGLDFTDDMKRSPTTFADTVGRGVVQRNFVKNPKPRAWGVQTFVDGTFDIPYRCLLPRGVEGLLMGSGRSVSASSPYLLRVMALTMVVGQAAGVAAAISTQQGVTPRSVDTGVVQRELMRQGVDLA